jgi:hypothetical protein
MTGVQSDPGFFFDHLTPQWWWIEHDDHTDCIFNRPEEWEYHSVLGWVETIPF